MPKAERSPNSASSPPAVDHPRTRAGWRLLRWAAAAWLGVSLLTLFVHLPALGHGFVNWDDNEYVYDNPHLKTIDSQFLVWALTSFHSLNWHPLTWLSHAVDRQLWGLDPQGHHLGNVLLHTANTFLVGVLVFVLMRCATQRPVESPAGAKAARKAARASEASGGFRRLVLPSLVAALLFGVHPLHVESVAWVSERKDVLSTFFMLLSALFYLRHAAAERRRWTSRSWAFSLSFFALALLSKPMPLTLPLVFLVLDVYPLKRLAFPYHGAK